MLQRGIITCSEGFIFMFNNVNFCRDVRGVHIF